MSLAMPTDAILVLNAGSSSLKFSIFDAASSGGLELRARGQLDQFGSAPRLVVRTRSTGSVVFHAAERPVIAAFARISLGLPPLGED